MALSDVPAAFCCGIRERHSAEDSLLFWQWISAKYQHLVKKFKNPDTEEDAINEHVIKMTKEYRNQKGNFSPGDDKDCENWNVKGSKKGNDKNGKGKSK